MTAVGWVFALFLCWLVLLLIVVAVRIVAARLQ
jgi:hypothetical protein